MTRLQTLENRLARLQELRDDYTGSSKIGGKIVRNPKGARYASVCTKIQREIRTLEN